MSTSAEKVVLREWESLLTGLCEIAPRAAQVVPLHAALQGALREAQEIREGRQIYLTAATEARQNLDRVLHRGREAAMTARNYLKFHYGPYNEELARFGVKPIRRGKGRKSKKAAGAGGEG